jgi:3'-phosphoadenosine 5'-phosphosulfate sulfotransferase (PAPS reductase)/FAD synthetase
MKAINFSLHLSVLLLSHPSEHLKEFLPTDEGWPPYMRVYPILQWSYREVWEYLLLFKVPYCSLYNEGCVVLN